MKACVISVIIGLLALAYYLPEPRIDRPPGILAADEPNQGPAGDYASWQLNGYKITPIASFSIRARVLFKEPYSMGREADTSPLDLTVGWGLMSDSEVLAQYDLTRGYRRFAWKARSATPPHRLTEVTRHTANIHIIPATADLARQLKALHPGNIIAMGGMLVKVEGKDGWYWRSSLSRDDIGDGACELMWVEWMQAS